MTLPFDLFVQAERTSDRASGGLGLGLALVKRLVELHDGTVTCRSEGLNKGSTFSICLPQWLEQGQGTSGFSDQDDLKSPTNCLRILVVDDNVDAAAMLAMLLEAMGHEVLVEHDPYRALERAKLDEPQVFILDIGLREIDGNELAQRLRTRAGSNKMMLIALTGYGQENDLKTAFAAGFDHHLVKPVDIQKLAAILGEFKVT